MGQGVQVRLVRALLQHGSEDDLLVALPAVHTREEGGGRVTACADVLSVKVLFQERQSVIDVFPKAIFYERICGFTETTYNDKHSTIHN